MSLALINCTCWYSWNIEIIYVNDYCVLYNFMIFMTLYYESEKV